MAETAKAIVHTDGNKGDVLFSMPSMVREFHEGDTFTYVDPSATETVYKIETVDYRIESISHPNPETSGNIWKEPEVFYGVSVVP